MLRVVQYLSVGLLVLLPAQALAGPAEEASAVIDHWAAAVNAVQPDAQCRYLGDQRIFQDAPRKRHQGHNW